jgi:hypothetical protein
MGNSAGKENIFSSIRREFVPEEGKWYFSVVDLVEILTDSKSPRNYWKVLKNRLKIKGNQLVTRCNQLKMQAQDGKFYLTDALDAEGALELAELLAPHKAPILNVHINMLTLVISPGKGRAVSVAPLPGEVKLPLDVYKTKTAFYVKAHLAGASIDDVDVTIAGKLATIKARRTRLGREPKIFSRIVTLPFPVHKNKIQKKEERGLITIMFPRLV